MKDVAATRYCLHKRVAHHKGNFAIYPPLSRKSVPPLRSDGWSACGDGGPGRHRPLPQCVRSVEPRAYYLTYLTPTMDRNLRRKHVRRLSGASVQCSSIRSIAESAAEWSWSGAPAVVVCSMFCRCGRRQNQLGCAAKAATSLLPHLPDANHGPQPSPQNTATSKCHVSCVPHAGRLFQKDVHRYPTCVFWLARSRGTCLYA